MDEKAKVTNKCPICGRPTHKESKYCIFHASAEEKTEEEFKQALKEYIQEIKEGDKAYDFDSFIFIGDINFKKDLNINIFKNADFDGAFFKGDARFEGVTFEGDAGFDRVTFEGDAGFDRVTFEENSEFNKANFKRDNRFEGTSFRGDAFFQEVIFEGDADFDGAFFKGDARFEGATFKGGADFKGTTFKGGADFKGTTFKGGANFVEVTFWGKADFVEVDFWRNADFRETTFKGYAYFGGTTFGGYAYFQQATFGEDTYFQQATFGEDTYFKLKNLMNIIDFSEIRISSGKKLSIKIINGVGKINFHRAYLENANLDMELVKGILVDFTDALLKNTKIRKSQIENYILQENKKNYNEAKEIYLLIKNNFHSIGQYEDESWAFKKEKDMDRLSHWFFSVNREKERNNEKKKNKTVFVPPETESSSEEKKYSFLRWIFSNHFSKWFFSGVSNIIYGYGERPWNVIKTAVAIILIFALSFSFIGLGNPEIIELKGTAIHQNSGNKVDLISKGLLKNNVIRNFPDSLYFSTITFTTLGYGDFRPLEGWGRILAGSEAFIGAFMMALFVYTFARRTGGR